MNTEPFIYRYRPIKWDEVIGNEDSVRSLRQVLTNNSSHAFLFTGPSGVGKALPSRTLVRTISGWTAIGDLQEGISLISIDGNTSQVTGVFPQGKKKIYEITFSDGVIVKCCGDHLWSVSHENWAVGSTKVFSTAILKELIVSYKRLRIPNVSGDFGNENNLPVNPYLLGFLIGDGSFLKSTIRFTAGDTEALERVISALPPECEIRFVDKLDWNIVNKQKSNKKTPVAYGIEELGLWKCLSHEKFIPQNYLLASKETRRSLMKGLLNSDGYTSPGGTLQYSTSSIKLAWGVLELANSLGWTATIRSRIPHYTYNGEKKTGKENFIITFLNPHGRDLATLSRHKKYLTVQTRSLGQRRIIKIIETDAYDDMTCISVSHPTGTFVISDYVVTHNTTLARLAAKELGTLPENLIEVDAATHNSIDEMRELTETLKYRPLGTSNIKSIILDECHSVTRQAWQSLLKMVEEPPTWSYWFFCTTDGSRVPDTIQTRCSVYNLKLLNIRELLNLLDWVLACEKRQIDPGILDLCVKEARGSPRRALAYLGQVINCQSREEAASAIGRLPEEAEAPVALARALVTGKKWSEVQSILNDLRNDNPESIRKIVLDYITKVIIDNKDESRIRDYLPILDEFAQSINYSDGIAPIVLASARIVFRAQRV